MKSWQSFLSPKRPYTPVEHVESGMADALFHRLDAGVTSILINYSNRSPSEKALTHLSDIERVQIERTLRDFALYPENSQQLWVCKHDMTYLEGKADMLPLLGEALHQARIQKAYGNENRVDKLFIEEVAKAGVLAIPQYKHSLYKGSETLPFMMCPDGRWSETASFLARRMRWVSPEFRQSISSTFDLGR